MKALSHFYYRIPFSETDAMGIVHHSNHARYFERARVDFLRLVGLPYTEVMNQGIHFPLTDMSVSFKKPLKFDDVIVVETKVSEVSKLRLNFAYRLFVATEERFSSLSSEAIAGAPSVIAETFHCSVNSDGRPVPMPPALLEKLLPLKGSL